MMAIILKVITGSLFRLIHTFAEKFGSPSTRVLSLLTYSLPFMAAYV